jgi:hypothetical protein
MFVGVVTAEVPTGFVVLQTRVVEQLFAPAAMVQSEAVRVPDGHAVVEKVASGEYPVPVVFVAYPR